MDLFSLLAKLTLDKTEYDDGLKEAEKSAEDLTIATPKIPKTDNTDFDAGIKEAETTGNIFKDVMVGVWDGIKSALVTTGIVGIVSNIVSSLREGINLATKNGDAISKGAKNLQLSTKAYQEYEYTLGKSNLRITDLQTAMTKFDTIRSGKITEDQAKYFEKLGINAEKASSGMMSAEEMLTGVMDSLADYKGADKGAIIDAFFGKSDKWTAYFDQTSSEIKDLKKEAEDLGYIMSEDAIKNAAEFTDATEQLATRLESIKRSFGEGILPGLTDATKTILKIIDFFAGSKEKSLSDMFADDDQQLAKDLLTIEETSTAAETLADKLIAMGSTAEMTADQYAIWQGTAQALIDLVPSLGDVIDIETGQINGNTDSIKANIKAWEDMAKAKALQNAKEKKWQEIVGKNEDLITKQIDVNQKLGEIEGKRATAMKLMNEYLGDEQYGSERQALSGFTEVTAENWEAAAKVFSNAMYQGSEMGKALKEFNDSKADLADLEQQAASLADEVANAKQEYESWSAAADQLFGTLNNDAALASAEVTGLAGLLAGLPDEKHITISISSIGGFPQAKGDWSVPFDNYPSLLHRGEMVLTKSQARKYREGQGTADYATIGAMISDSINKAFKKVNVLMNGEKVGDLTTKRVNRNVNANSYSRQRAYGG